MFERLGVPLDGSPCAERAQPSAGTVVLLRVVDPRGDLKPYYPSDLGWCRRWPTMNRSRRAITWRASLVGACWPTSRQRRPPVRSAGRSHPRGSGGDEH